MRVESSKTPPYFTGVTSSEAVSPLRRLSVDVFSNPLRFSVSMLVMDGGHYPSRSLRSGSPPPP